MKRTFNDARRKLSWFVLFVLICLGNPVRGQNPGPSKETDLTPAQRKIAPLIRSAMAQMVAAGVNRSNAVSLNAAQQYSSPLIKVDNQARIQVYMDLTELNAGRLATLAAIPEIEI